MCQHMSDQLLQPPTKKAGGGAEREDAPPCVTQPVSSSVAAARHFFRALAAAKIPFSVGMVAGKFYPVHTGHQRLICSAASHCDLVLAVVGQREGDVLTGSRRAAWLESLVPIPVEEVRGWSNKNSSRLNPEALLKALHTLRGNKPQQERIRGEPECVLANVIGEQDCITNASEGGQSRGAQVPTRSAGVVCALWCFDDIANTSEAWARRALDMAAEFFDCPPRQGLVNFTFGSEPYLFKWSRLMGATHVPLMRSAGVHPEARTLREELHLHWDQLAAPAQKDLFRFIHVVGRPEATSRLAQRLSSLTGVPIQPKQDREMTALLPTAVITRPQAQLSNCVRHCSLVVWPSDHHKQLLALLEADSAPFPRHHLVIVNDSGGFDQSDNPNLRDQWPSMSESLVAQFKAAVPQRAILETSALSVDLGGDGASLSGQHKPVQPEGADESWGRVVEFARLGATLPRLFYDYAIGTDKEVARNVFHEASSIGV